MNQIFKNIALSSIIFLSTSYIAPAQTPVQEALDDTLSYSWIDRFNSYAQSADLAPLDHPKYSTGTFIRLWSPFSHTLGVQLLNIELNEVKSKADWIVAWAEWGANERKKRLSERWPCRSEIDRVEIKNRIIASCILKRATSSEINYVKNELNKADIEELVTLSIESRVQLDGSSIHVERRSGESYNFKSFMNYHLNNHSKRQKMKKIHNLIYYWKKE